MKRIGLLGGMSWESSIEYERVINEAVRERLGGIHSADLVIRSYDFADIEALQTSGAWDDAAHRLARDAAALEQVGTELIVLCTNTLHSMAVRVEAAITVPFLHIADATAAAIRARNLHTVGLLGNSYTMEQPFYRDRLGFHGIDVFVPHPGDRAVVQRVIFDELVRGPIDDTSRRRVLTIIDELLTGGAEGIAAGCTEIELHVPPELVTVPYFPTARLTHWRPSTPHSPAPRRPLTPSPAQR